MWDQPGLSAEGQRLEVAFYARSRDCTRASALLRQRSSFVLGLLHIKGRPVMTSFSL